MTGSQVARNAIWNLLGLGLPLVVAVFAIPPLVRELGIDRFGILTLAWAIIGYLGIFDLGIGRALTKAVAQRLGSGAASSEPDDPHLPELVWSAVLITFVLGLVATLVILPLSGWLSHDVLRVTPGLEGEMQRAIMTLGLAMPLVLGTAGLRGVLEAHRRFELANAIRLPMGVYNFVAPLAMLPFTRDVGSIVVVLAVGRALAWLAHLLACFRVMPGLRRWPRLALGRIGGLMRDGGWMTVSNVLGPVMVYFDRFLIGALVSLAAVAYYATPFEGVSRLLVIPAALVGVLFPSFAADQATRPEQARALYGRACIGTLGLMFPAVVVVSAVAPELLRVWVGADFATHSTVVLRWLAYGVLLNSLAHVPFAYLQAAGRADLTARLHLIEAPLYLLGLWWAIDVAGVQGAAIAWALRVAIDALALFALTHRVGRLPIDRGAAWGTALALGSLAIAVLDVTPSLAVRLALAAGTLAVFGVTLWRWLLDPAGREWIRARLAWSAGR